MTIEQLEAQPRFTRSDTLFELERRFGEPAIGATRSRTTAGWRCSPRPESSPRWRRSEPRWRGCSTRSPSRGDRGRVARSGISGPLYRRVCSRFAIPTAVQADLAVTRTVTGTGLIALLEAAVGRRRATDLLAYLRTPGIASPSRVDWFERKMLRGRLRSAEEAFEAWARDTDNGDRGLPAIEKLRAAAADAALLREAGKQARWIAELAIRGRGEVAGEDRSLELRAGAEIERALAELAELDLPHTPQDVIAAVAGLVCRCGEVRPRDGSA